ncbi:MAG: S41 family peptidase [Mucilaginibacter sp.]
MMKKLLLIIFLLSGLSASSQTFNREQYREDFNYFWTSINDNYCYFEKKHITWADLKPGYDKQIDTITSRNSFVATIEKVFYELYDHHCSLGTNTPLSRRLVPTSADIWAEYTNGKPVITELRKGFGAEQAGIKAGMEVIAVDDVPVNKAILPYLGRVINAESKSFALRLLLAGNHIAKRKFTLKTKSGLSDFFPDRDSVMLEHVAYPAMVEAKEFGAIGYIRINNFLFDNALIPKFDSVLNTLLQKKAIIIDLRETPSGGNTAVARSILGRFISKDNFYQKHELYAEEKETGIKRSWVEIVSPRGITYTKPLVTIADHWTGSISEGITIAFDGMKRATIIGTQLARLNGAVESYRMPNSKIGFNFTTERLYHINSTPREQFNPTITVDVTTQKPGNDVILNTALDFLRHKISTK